MGLGHGIGGLVGGLVWRRWHGGAAGAYCGVRPVYVA